jgi:HTH-type transcriptional regulator/antitoxin HigA
MLAEELEARAMSQKALALKMGRPVQVVNEIVLGKKQIVAKTALDLEAALKIPAEFWMNLEIGYQLTKARLEREQKSKASARGRASVRPRASQ